MSLKIIHTDKAPKAVGPYSQAVRAGDFIFCSGQISIDPATQRLELFGGDAALQAKQVLANLKEVLSSEGLPLSSVAKATIFLSDMNDFAKVNEVYAGFFGDHRPARATVEVSRLPKDVAVEMDVIAFAK